MLRAQEIEKNTEANFRGNVVARQSETIGSDIETSYFFDESIPARVHNPTIKFILSSGCRQHIIQNADYIYGAKASTNTVKTANDG
jgi:hypothetical protein